MHITPEQYRQSANIVTYGRLIGTSVVLGDMLAAEKASRRSYRRAAVFAGIAALDGLDGWLARKSGDPNPNGATLDQEADKVCVATTKAALGAACNSVGSTASLLVDLPRDYLVNRKRRELRENDQSAGARGWGKLKTAVNFAVMTADMTPLGERYPKLLRAGYAGCVALTALSGWEFISTANTSLAQAQNPIESRPETPQACTASGLL